MSKFPYLEIEDDISAGRWSQAEPGLSNSNSPSVVGTSLLLLPCCPMGVVQEIRHLPKEDSWGLQSEMWSDRKSLYVLVLLTSSAICTSLSSVSREQLSAKLVWLVWIACIENSRIIVFQLLQVVTVMMNVARHLPSPTPDIRAKI